MPNGIHILWFFKCGIDLSRSSLMFIRDGDLGYTFSSGCSYISAIFILWLCKVQMWQRKASAVTDMISSPPPYTCIATQIRNKIMSILPRRPFTDCMGVEKPGFSPTINTQAPYTRAQIDHLGRRTGIELLQGNPKRPRGFANESELTGQKRPRYSEEYRSLPREIQSNTQGHDLGYVPRALLSSNKTKPLLSPLELVLASEAEPWISTYNEPFHERWSPDTMSTIDAELVGKTNYDIICPTCHKAVKTRSELKYVFLRLTYSD